MKMTEQFDNLFDQYSEVAGKLEPFLKELYETVPMDPSELSLMFHLISHAFLIQSLEDTGVAPQVIQEIIDVQVQKHKEEPVDKLESLTVILLRHSKLLGLNLTIFDSIIKSIYKETEKV